MKRSIVSAALLLCLVPSCKAKDAPAPGGSGGAGAPAPSGVPRPAPKPELPRGEPIPLTDGPRLLILPGQGVGPIRIGATVATIERLMDKPCEVKDARVCRYEARAVEFLLDEQGFTREIRIHRAGRGIEGAGPEHRYGIFNGHTDGGLAPLMLKSAVKEVLGPPLEVTPSAAPGIWNSVEVHRYPGMRLEIDKLPNGREVVGGIYLVKDAPPR